MLTPWLLGTGPVLLLALSPTLSGRTSLHSLASMFVLASVSNLFKFEKVTSDPYVYQLVFLNSLLAMLNGRVELKERMTRNFSEQLQRSYSAARPPDFSRSAFSNVEYNQKPSVSTSVCDMAVQLK